MQKFAILNKMIEQKLAVVIRGDTFCQAEKIADACIKGGVTTLEITFTIPRADKLITAINEKKKPIIVGAGTVLDAETARIAILSGAKFIVSPTFNVDIAKLCNRYSVPYLPGCMTINEITEAMEYGVSIVKLFPSRLFDFSFIKDIKGPLPHVEVMPTGGVNITNAQSWLKAGALLLGIGGEITSPGKEEKFDEVEQLASQFVQIINEV